MPNVTGEEAVRHSIVRYTVALIGTFMLFPSLKGKLKQRAGTLSGGEKQMLALSNALILSPRLVLLEWSGLQCRRPLGLFRLPVQHRYTTGRMRRCWPEVHRPDYNRSARESLFL